MKKRLISILLCVMLLLSLMPTAVFAARIDLVTVNVEVPIHKVVKQGGNQAPGNQTFTFELSGLSKNAQYSKTSFEIETKGAGADGTMEYTGTLSFSMTATSMEELIDALNNGFFVSEKQEEISGWTLDTNSWYVAPVEFLDDTKTNIAESTINFFYFYDMSKVVDQSAPARSGNAYSREMTFTNTYGGVETEYLTFTLPYEKIVKENGTSKAPEQVFTFELFDLCQPEVTSGLISVDGDSIKTNGAGTYKGDIEITVPATLTALGNLSEGFKIREKQGNAAHWTYDDSEWTILLQNVGDDWDSVAQKDWEMVIMKGDSDAGEATVARETFNKMTFTNTYTWSEAVAQYTLHYESNGGTEYNNEVYAPNTEVKMDKYPSREGYTFTGWYSDSALKNKITTVTMDADKTVYAGWNQTPVPEYLNGTDHFAYIVGYEDGCIRPTNNITRAEVATIFYRLLKLEYRIKYETQENNFTDVNSKDWFCTAVSTLAHMGILNGRSATSFEPNANITRAEFAAICARCDESIEKGVSCFTDLNGHWAKAEVEKAAYLGWIKGYADGSFQPNKNITRAESFTLINRVLQRLPGSTSDLLPGMAKWPDNADPNAWYYIAVQEATCSHEYERKADGHEKWVKLVDNVF